MRRPPASIPITLTSTLVAITIVLTVGWEILVAREFRALVEGFTAVHWMLVILGSLFFVVIITASILQAAWLVREIRTNQRQQNFIDAVTHELHTPLASLGLYLDTLAKPGLDDARHGEFVEIMREDLKRLQRTIDRLLDAARSEVRRVRNESVDLADLLRECVVEARELHGLARERVRLETPDCVEVRGDREQLRVAFRNLIENAIRYAGRQLQVDVCVRPRTTRTLEIEVADQGQGIPSSALRRIFARFEGVRSRHGLGLGLYIVRNVVRAHGGSVRAESEGPGRGSRFIVRLPGQLDGHAHPAG